MSNVPRKLEKGPRLEKSQAATECTKKFNSEGTSKKLQKKKRFPSLVPFIFFNL